MFLSKSTMALAAIASLVAVAQADQLQISNPTLGTVWRVGEPVFLQWGGNCASMDHNAQAVDVDLTTGEANSLRFVAKLGTIDCSGSETRKEFTIPPEVVRQSGRYSLSVQTTPDPSYSNIFTIETESSKGPSSRPAAPGDSADQRSGASVKTVGSAVSLALVAAIFHFL